MNRIIEKILLPDDTEYLAITHELLILETSTGVKHFADFPNEVIKGKDVRLGFPELVGLEDYLINILKGQQKSFRLEGIARCSHNSPLYIDLYITRVDGFLIILIKDATERMILSQQLVHQNNQTNLLLNALSTSRNYLDKIISSLKDVLLVTTQLGQIIRTNKSTVDLFEYSQEELINQSISMIIADGNTILERYEYNPIDIEDYFNNNSIICQSKTGKELIIKFSVSIIETEIKGLQHFVYIGRNITEQKIAENALIESEELFKAFMNNSPAVAFMKDCLGRYVYINKTFEDKHNIQISQLQGKTDFDWLPETVAKQLNKNDSHVFLTGKTMQVIEVVPTADGCLHHWLVFRFLFRESHQHQLVGGVAVDISDRILLEQELFAEKELAQVTLKSIGDAVITTDASGQIKYLNPVAEKLTGWKLKDVCKKHISQVFKIVNEMTRETIENPVELALRQSNTINLVKDYILITRDGNQIPINNSVAPIHDKSSKIVGAVMVFQDVGHQRHMARQLSWQATHDALSGLFNRREFERRLQEVLNDAKSGNQYALCYLDLDRFKIVNDTCGHLAGDELLRQVTALFQSELRCSDTLARLGGDEFGILLYGCSFEPALAIAENIVQKIREFRFVWEDKTFSIGVSIGLVMIDASNSSINAVLSAADTACYTAKNKGRDRVHIYQANDSEIVKVRGQMQWIAIITQALQNNSFCLYYQSIVPIIPDKSYGEHYEVLLRLIDTAGNLISPMAFIPAAERYNLMQAIDRWVINTLFAGLEKRDSQAWNSCSNKGSDCGCMYAINLSGASINDDLFIEFLREQFTLYQVPPQAICFEITETVAITNLAKAANFIYSLKEIGCRFALDDFGSGMSSFGYLKNLSVDYLKIDGNFIKRILEEPIDLAIIESINQIGHLMGIQTIAEFVESQAILDKITAIGIDFAQGNGVAEPLPLCFAESLV
jgi:diguanylate cyclase (GGDEF)-like protein/PAS domain S-box-containing protein